MNVMSLNYTLKNALSGKIFVTYNHNLKKDYPFDAIIILQSH